MPQFRTSQKRSFSAWRKEGLFFNPDKKPLRNQKTKRFLLRLGVIFGVPLGILLGCETILRIVGYGVSLEFFAKTDDGQYLIPNTHFSRRFFPPDVIKEPWPFKIPVKKEEGTKRIFVIGDSAAQGTPAPAFGFTRILQVMLERQFPDHKFEVVNVAMRGINSHVMIPIARECAKYDADAFLVYAGNNETVGLYAPSPDGFNIVDYPLLIQLKHVLCSTKLYQMANKMLLKMGKNRIKPFQDFEFFQKQRIDFAHKSRISVARNFESNLEKICKAGISKGVKVFLSTVAVNLEDCPPFGSLHRENIKNEELKKWNYLVKQGDEARAKRNYREALRHYSEAITIDPQYAELQYKIALCYKELGDLNLAIEHFKLARDFDCLPFRADDRLNQAIRKTASKFDNNKVILVDSENSFLAHAINRRQIPGNSLFHEHVHLKFSGDYLLAKTFFEKLALILFPEIHRDNRLISRFPTEQECALMLAFTPWDELDINAAMVKLTASPLFQGQLDHQSRQAESERMLNEKLKKFSRGDLKKCAAIYEYAISNRPTDWQLHFNYANLLQLMENYEQACREYQIVLTHVPFFKQCQSLYNTSLTFLKYQQSSAQVKR